MTVSPAPVPSPCVRICVLEPATSVCIGCGRTIDEIASWAGLSDETRLAIIGMLDERMSRLSAGAA